MEKYIYTVGRVVAVTPARFKSANYKSVHKQGAALVDSVASHTESNNLLFGTYNIVCKSGVTI